jgi:predicted amidophosphoribosyltransferase
MKNIDDWAERQAVLTEAVQVGDVDVRGKIILLVDDLIESGSTLRRAAEVLLKDGTAQAVYALVLTRTK